MINIKEKISILKFIDILDVTNKSHFKNKIQKFVKKDHFYCVFIKIS